MAARLPRRCGDRVFFYLCFPPMPYQVLKALSYLRTCHLRRPLDSIQLALRSRAVLDAPLRRALSSRIKKKRGGKPGRPRCSEDLPP